jgi:5-methylcytosine-specific restriction endonuclease McrA
MKRSGFIQRKTPLLRTKKPEPHRKEHVSLAFPKPGDMKKEIEVEHVYRDGRTKINQNCKAGRDLYQERKRFAWEEQEHICPICYLHLNWGDSTVDHIRPRSVGFDDRQENIAAVHAICNCERGSKQHGFYGVA